MRGETGTMLTSFIWHLTHFPTLLPAVTAAQNFSIGSVEFSFLLPSGQVGQIQDNALS